MVTILFPIHTAPNDNLCCICGTDFQDRQDPRWYVGKVNKIPVAYFIKRFDLDSDSKCEALSKTFYNTSYGLIVSTRFYKSEFVFG